MSELVPKSPPSQRVRQSGTAPGSASEGQIEPDRQKPTRLGPSPKLQKREKNSARTEKAREDDLGSTISELMVGSP